MSFGNFLYFVNRNRYEDLKGLYLGSAWAKENDSPLSWPYASQTMWGLKGYRKHVSSSYYFS